VSSAFSQVAGARGGKKREKEADGPARPDLSMLLAKSLVSGRKKGGSSSRRGRGKKKKRKVRLSFGTHFALFDGRGKGREKRGSAQRSFFNPCNPKNLVMD